MDSFAERGWFSGAVQGLVADVPCESGGGSRTAGSKHVGRNIR